MVALRTQDFSFGFGSGQRYGGIYRANAANTKTTNNEAVESSFKRDTSNTPNILNGHLVVSPHDDVVRG